MSIRCSPSANVLPAGHHQQTEGGRNDPCPCGSGKKFKKCCGG
ncbi:MAG: SEC-C metal-binding domain-containing protein [Candidatus Tectomicrobia bacterium]|nr:SEC-C metal-binding domain-containing protein [Candidatus Tectomicrobia bacterium]